MFFANIKKNWRPFLLALALLGVFSLLLVDQNKNRFTVQHDDTGNESSLTGGAPVLGKIEWTWYDLKFRLIDRFGVRNHEKAKGVLVARIDDASLERYGRWPWNRRIYEEILNYLNELGAEVVGFDAVFSEPEFESRYVKESLEWKGQGMPESIRDKIKLSDDNTKYIADTLPRIGNTIFGSAVSKYPKTVLGYFWQAGSACLQLYNPDDPKEKASGRATLSREDATRAGLLHVEALVDNLSTLTAQGISDETIDPLTPEKTPVFLGSCPTVNRGEIAGNSKHQGFFSAVSDSDGIFRRIPLVTGFLSSFVPEGNRDFLPPEWFKQGTFFPSLAVETVSAYWDSPSRKIEAEKVGDRYELRALVINRKEGAPVRIPTLPDGTVPLNFYGSQDTNDKPIGEFSLAGIDQVRDPNFQARYGLDPLKPLAGQIILIGPTALGVYDLRPNPVQGDAAGVFLHATIAARLLELGQNPQTNFAVRFAGVGTNLAILWATGLLLTFWLFNFRALGGVVGNVSLILTLLAIDFGVFVLKGVAFDAMTIVVGLSTVFLGIFAWKYFTEEKERAFVKGAFEKYVSPDLVGQIMEDPKKLNLGGKKAELSVLFSDVRGFTTISEKMDAAGLARFMNEYLSPMTDIVQANKGTIDKYMGDAIMAIFGAPIEYQEHAAKAVDAALAMMAKLPEMVKEWEARGLPPIDIGIGINTGEMSVGNMGSSRIFSYTVMGDSVNLGSRLEGINKEYGTNIIVSEFTRKHLPAEYLCRELDRVKVKGKKLPVTIFEVMGKAGFAGEAQKKAVRDRFEEALKLYYARKFNDAKIIFEAQAKEDKTSEIYIERCDYWTEHAPEADWDGSWTMKTK